MRRALLAVLAALALTACRLDVVAEVQMEPDGTGVVIVDAVADAELVAKVPDLVDDLRLEDAVANGWVVEGPTAQEGGGLAIRLTHPFASDAELASLLNSIGPPLVNMQAARTSEADAAAATGDAAPETGRVTNAIEGTLTLTNGFQSFADAALVEAVGGQPFGEEIAASGLTPAQAMSFTFRASLPGELAASTGRDVGDGVIEWQAALDGSAVALRTETVQEPASVGNSWARPLATVSLLALIAWLLAAAAFIAFVAVARRSKRRRREQALRTLRQRSTH